ncbi:MAG: peptide-methionine (R)-S-oxide reductase MsrB [Deltaproteobacteria bacterium]|nr:peptide-methionine (R)-S-oxide reductase MsrB [Deltaproteobacteria bacterium]
MILSRRHLLAALALIAGGVTLPACPSQEARAEDPPAATTPGAKKTMSEGKIELTDAEWKAKLTDEQYRILRKAGTERAFTGALWDEKKAGVYRCAGCGQVLYRSDEKFDSGSGWPSFWAPASEEAIDTKSDRTLWMVRTELLCSRCGGHLGHVFDDGPKPTGQRHCINSAALQFEPTGASEAAPEK